MIVAENFFCFCRKTSDTEGKKLLAIREASATIRLCRSHKNLDSKTNYSDLTLLMLVAENYF